MEILLHRTGGVLQNWVILCPQEKSAAGCYQQDQGSRQGGPLAALSSGDLKNTVGVEDSNSKWKTFHLNEKGGQEGFIVIPWWRSLNEILETV